ncbi:MAG: EVE domain-containing protein [Patescibacteria group bacterium]
MAYWLIKTDPQDYGWEDLLREGSTSWTGVRNFQARNFMSEMKVGDLVVVYDAGDDKEIRGIAEVSKEAYPDPTAEEGKWVAVDIKAVKPCGRPLHFEEIRNTYGLSVMPLVEQPRLTVHAVTEPQWQSILKYSKTTL